MIHAISDAPAPVIALLGEALEDVFPGEGPAVGGAPLNVACHLRAFGLSPLLVTRIGDDSGGERLMKFFQRHGLSTKGVQRDGTYPTGQVFVHAEGTRTAFDIPFPQAFDFLDAGEAAATVGAARPAAVYFGTLAQRHEAARGAVRAAVGGVRAFRFCDLNLRPPWACAEVVRASLARAEILKLNDEELRSVVARLEIPAGGNAPRALLEAYPVGTLFVTEGESGARRFDRTPRGVEETRAAARPAAPLVDTVGAGDGFAAVALLGLVRGWPAGVTLARANEFAGALCGVRGAVPADEAFYAPFRARWELAA